MDLDPQVERYLERLRAAGVPPPQELGAQQVRRNLADAAAELFGPVDPVASVEDRSTDGGIPVRVYTPEEAGGPRPALVYLHGGGWVAGSLDTHDGIVRALARRSGRTAIAVDYRLAPEHPFPAGLEDAWAATRWVLAQAAELGVDAARVAVGGDSSGATLAAVVARRARDAGTPLERQVLVCPVLDHRLETESYERFAQGYGLTREGMRWYWGQYLGDADGSDPDASPLRAPDLGGLPPAVVLVAGYDPLHDEGIAYAEGLEAAGVPTKLLPYDGTIHNFVRLAASIDAASRALDELARELA